VNGQVLHFDAATHKVADVLLPWFVNGTLEDEERALVEQHLSQCERCRREVEWLQELHAACAGVSTAVPHLRERLMRRTTSGIAGRFQARWQRAHSWSRAVMAAQLAAILVLGAVVVGDETRAPYRTLGAADSTARAPASLVVVFDPAVTELDLRRILRAVGARIVDGPTQANAYLLDVAPGAREQAIRALQVDRRVVLVEPLGEGSGR
jgi:anti-sigma-K factor RskA